jgi:Tfp pilus assembly protein PilN
MRAVNLLPPERRQAPAKSPLAPLARRPLFVATGGVVLLVALALGVLAHSAGSSVSTKRRELADVQRQLADARARQVLSASALASASARRTTIVGIAGRRVSWDAFLGGLSRVLPEDVWLVSLSADPAGAALASDTASTTSSTSSSTTSTTSPDMPFAISGYAYSQSSVARLMDRLALIPWLSGVQLQSSALAPVGNRNAFQFSIGASMTNMGGAS